MKYSCSDAEVTELEQAVQRRPADAGLSVTLAWHLRERDPLRARSLVDTAEALLPTVADAASRAVLAARCCLMRSHAEWLLNRLDEAGQLAVQARVAFVAAGDEVGDADACLLAALVFGSQGDLVQRDRMSRSAIDSGRKSRDVVRLRVAELSVARDVAMKSVEEGLRLMGLSLADPPTCNDPVEKMYAEIVHAQCELTRGRSAQQGSHLEEVYRLALEAGELRLAAWAAGNVAVVRFNLGDVAGALHWSETALGISRPRNLHRPTATALYGATEILREMGRYSEAQDLILESKAILSTFPHSLPWAFACDIHGRLALTLGANAEALATLLEAEVIARREQAFKPLSGMLCSKAEALSRLHRVDEALACAHEALQLQSGQDAPYRSDALHALASIARRHALPVPPGSKAQSAAIHYLEAALAEVARRERPHSSAADWLEELSVEFERVGEWPSALDCSRRSAQARAKLHEKKAADLATGMHLRQETERVRLESAHHKAMAEAEARRADAEAQANRAKSSFLANMSHELRSPLNAMLGFTRLLLRDASLAAHREELSIVMRSGEQLCTLINQVLDMSKIESSHVALVETDFDLHALLDELRDMLSGAVNDKGIRMTMSCDAPQHVRGDAGKLRQVLTNLLSNAIKFTPQGSVELLVCTKSGGSSPRLDFAVSDTGVGIEQNDLATLGQPFVQAPAGQRAAEGTGLGLAISRGLVRLLGGTLQLSSVPGQGTCASFTVPLQLAEGVQSTSSRASFPHRASWPPGIPTPRILVVDDRADGRLLLARTLRPLGFDVKQAADGAQAIEAWKEWAPHIVLMDMRMPVMDGQEATRRIKATEQGRSTVVIALTASSFEEQREDILAAGCDDFIRKPFQEEELLQVLAKHFPVQFAYDDGPPPAHPIDAARLASLPEPLRLNMCAALNQLDVQAVDTALAALREHDAIAADALMPLARRFQYERMRALLTVPVEPAV